LIDEEEDGGGGVGDDDDDHEISAVPSEWASVVGIAIDYGLDDRGVGV
jgi:hypothetical protein